MTAIPQQRDLGGGLADLFCVLEGVRCGGCTSKIERSLGASDGVALGRGSGGLQLRLDQAHGYRERGPSRFAPFFGPMMISNMVAGLVAIEFGLRWPNHCVVSA